MNEELRINDFPNLKENKKSKEKLENYLEETEKKKKPFFSFNLSKSTETDKKEKK